MTTSELVRHAQQDHGFQAWDSHFTKFVEELPRNPLFEEHLYLDGLFTFVRQEERMPTAAELAAEMLDEWDDPVDEADAQRFLDALA